MVPYQFRSRCGFLPSSRLLVPIRLHGAAKALARGLCLAVVLLFSIDTGAARSTHPVERGMEGLAKIPFEARNDGAEPIACGVSLAHWYSLDLGEAAPGAVINATLYVDPETGEVFLLNASEDRMAVESLWCGIAGRSWATRNAIALDRRAGDVPAPIRLVCAAEGGRLICR